jgi:hypothetical protein
MSLSKAAAERSGCTAHCMAQARQRLDDNTGMGKRCSATVRKLGMPVPLISTASQPVASAARTLGAAAREGEGEWQSLYPAWVSAIVGRLLAGRPGQPAFEVNPGLLPLTELLGAVNRTPAEFNRALDAFKAATAAYSTFLTATSTSFLALRQVATCTRVRDYPCPSFD